MTLPLLLLLPLLPLLVTIFHSVVLPPSSRRGTKPRAWIASVFAPGRRRQPPLTPISETWRAWIASKLNCAAKRKYRF